LNKKISNADYLELVKKLKIIRLSLEKKHKEWAEFLEINTSDVSKLESGTKLFTAHELMRIAKIPNLNLNYLFLDDDKIWLDDRIVPNQNKIDAIKGYEGNLKKEVETLKNKVEKMETTMELLRAEFRELDLEEMANMIMGMIEVEKAKNEKNN